MAKSRGPYFSRVLSPFVAPWVPVTSEPPVRGAQTPPEEVLPEATIRWGAASQFGENSFREQAKFPGFRVKPKEFPPLWGTYQEEGRTWTDFTITDPEGTGGEIIVRKTNEIAFRAMPETAFPDPDDPNEVRGEQVTWSFSNPGMDSGEDHPPYLHNTKGEEFDPIVLSPLESIVEVSWGVGDFILIAIEVKPRTSVDFAIQVKNPRDTNIRYPESPKGDPEIDQHPETPEQEENENFLDQKTGGTIIDNTSPGQPETQDEEKALGMGPPPEIVQSLPAFSGVSVSVAGNAAAFKGTVHYSTWGQWVGENAGWGGCDWIGTMEWVEVGPDTDPRIMGRSGCLYPWANRKIDSVDPPVTNFSPFFIPSVPGDGEVQDPQPGVIPRYQWKLDRGVTQKDGTTNGIGMASDDFGGSAPAVWYYRKWETPAPRKYDDEPFVYVLFFVDAALLRKWMAPLLALQGSNNELIIEVLAGGADDPLESQGVEGGHSGMKSGRLRWSWYKGSAREAYENWQPPEYEEDNPPSYDQVWDDIDFKDDGLLNSDEVDFPSGASIEGDVNVQKTYRVLFPTRELIEDHVP